MNKKFINKLGYGDFKSFPDKAQITAHDKVLKVHSKLLFFQFNGNGQFFFNMEANDNDQGKRKRHGDNPEKKKMNFDPGM